MKTPPRDSAPPKLAAFFLLLFCLLGAVPRIFAAEIDFKADFYTRDLQTNTIKGKGNAWLKRDGREFWADEVEVDLNTKRATARGNVHIREADLDIWCKHASFNIEGYDAILEDIVLVSGSVVLTGVSVKRLDKQRFEIEEGSYSNCNTTYLRDVSAGKCALDWKLYGRSFSLTLESYAHVQDAIVYIRNLPVFYSPYFVAPVKTERQSGVLQPSYRFTDNLGSGFTLPYYQVLGKWHDLTLSPTVHSKTGYHLGVNYRYVYSGFDRGEVSLFLLQRRFSYDKAAPSPDNKGRERFLGFIGEWAVDLRNRFSLGGRAHSSQILKLVSHPFYTFDYSADLGLAYELPSLRSMATVTYPGDELLFTGRVEHQQSLVISRDSGVDRGPVTQLPTLTLAQKNTSFLDQYFSVEWDTRLTNFYRGESQYDTVSPTLDKTVLNHTPDHTDFQFGDYLRAGRRLQLEPRLIVNIPAPSGFQIQPVLRAGTLVYHFDEPQSKIVHREYADFEFPFSMNLSRTFETGIPGYEKIHHVFQPRIIYAASVYQGESDHPFFYRDPTRGLSNPRFDFSDQILPFEYLRFELINRFRRYSRDGIDRFILFQLSEQYNLRTSPEDPRYSQKLGPIEVLGEFKIWRFGAQVQANYQLETINVNGEEIRENDVSSTLIYSAPNGDRVSVGNRLRIQRDQSLTEKTALLGFYKRLPTFFDLEGGLEYSYKRGDLLGSRLSFIFGSKPVSCWGVTFTFGQNDIKQKFVRLLFRIDFGKASGTMKGT